MNIALKMLLFMVPLWSLSGLMIIDTDEVGMIKRFGALNRVENSGLQFRLPWPIETVEYLQVTDVKTITLDKRLSLTGDANLVEVQAIVQYVIAEPISYATKASLGYYVKHFQGPQSHPTLGVSGLILTPLSIAPNCNRRLIHPANRCRSTELGLIFEAVEIQELNAPSQVIDAFYDLSSACGDKQTLILSARTYRSKLLPDSRGKAAAMKEKAAATAAEIENQSIAQTRRFTNLLTSWKQQPKAVRDRALSAFWAQTKDTLEIIPVTTETEVYLQPPP